MASRTRLICAGRPVAYEDVAHGEAAELVGLVGAGARDEVGDDLVERGVARRRPPASSASPRRAPEPRTSDVRRRGRPDVACPRTRVRAWSRVPLSSATNAGTCTGSRRSSGPVGAADHPAGGGEQRAPRPAANAMSAATGWRQPKLCSATRARAAVGAEWRRRRAARGRRRGWRVRPRPEPLDSAAKSSADQGDGPGGADRRTAVRRAAGRPAPPARCR